VMHDVGDDDRGRARDARATVDEGALLMHRSEIQLGEDGLEELLDGRALVVFQRELETPRSEENIVGEGGSGLPANTGRWEGARREAHWTR
jgi:hypothetical protein